MIGIAIIFAGSGSASFGDGVGIAAAVRNPQGIAVSSNGYVFVADTNNHRIRMISSSGVYRAFLKIVLYSSNS